MQLKEVFRYTGTLYAVNLLASAVTFVVVIFISREISKEAMGAYGLFQAYFLAGAYFSGMGVSPTLVKYVAAREVDIRQIHSVLLQYLGAIAVVLIGAGSALVYFGYEILGLVLMTLPAYHLFDFALSYARGHLWKKTESLLLLASSLGTSVFIVLLLHWFPDHHGPIYGQMLSYYVIAGVALIGFLRLPRVAEGSRFQRVQGGWIKGFCFTAAPIFVTAMLASFSEVVDRLLIERFLGLVVLAEYFIAMAFFNILDKPVSLLSRVLLSYFSGTNDPAKHRESLIRLVKFNTFVFPVMGLALIAILPPILMRFMNKDYTAAFDILAIASIVMVVKSFEVINSVLNIAKDNPRANMYSQAISLVVYVPVALVLLKLFGIYGVAFAIVLRWVAFSLYQFMHMRNNAVATVSAYLLLRALVAYGLALACFHVAPWAMVPVYLLAGFALKLWSREDFMNLPLLRPLRAVEK